MCVDSPNGYPIKQIQMTVRPSVYVYSHFFVQSMTLGAWVDVRYTVDHKNLLFYV